MLKRPPFLSGFKWRLLPAKNDDGIGDWSMGHVSSPGSGLVRQLVSCSVSPLVCVSLLVCLSVRLLIKFYFILSVI